MGTTTYSRVAYWKTGGTLLLLLGMTWSLGYIDLGLFNLIAALAIALTKAVLVALFFMHIKRSSRILRLAAMCGIIWLLILLSLTISDYLTRTHL